MQNDTGTERPQNPPFSSLTSRQRRVLGVLVEKGYTTPEYYPLTLKAVTTGCNQKSNRDPVVDYSEDSVYETLDQLREMGVVGFVHTESGRTERYRHYLRHCLTLSEQQLAVLTELLLRGRQQLGELRTRASRMRPIDSLEQLREELAGLIEMSFVRAGGPLERRGIEVDHDLYSENERSKQPAFAAGTTEEACAPAVNPSRHQSPPPPTGTASSRQADVAQLQEAQRALQDTVDSLQETVARLEREFGELRRDLGN